MQSEKEQRGIMAPDFRLYYKATEMKQYSSGIKRYR